MSDGASRVPDRTRVRSGDGGRIGWGIVGCGWVVRDYVAPAILGSANGEIVALCDHDEAALDRVGVLAAGSLRYATLSPFLKNPLIDAVYVATPNSSHAEIVRAAAAAGKPLLCEKPMARTAAEAAAMVDACAAAGVPYATAFDQRFHAAHRRLGALVAEGTLGTVTCVRIHYACWTPPDWQPAEYAHDNWRVDPARAGGGAMIDLAPHGLDLVQTLLGEPITTVACLLQRRVFDYPVDDGAVISARTASGVLVSHAVAYNRPDAFPRRELEVIGDRGRALATNTMGQTPGGRLTLTGLDGVEHDVPFADEDRSPFTAQVEAFAACLLAGEPFPFPPARDLHTMRLVEACAREEVVHVEPPAAWDARAAMRAGRGASRRLALMPLAYFACDHCGFWQRHFAPSHCPVCEDFRHPLPADGWSFSRADAVAARTRCRVDEVLPGLLAVSAEPPLGIGPSGYLLRTAAGNVAFEGCGWYDDDALDALADAGDVRWAAASHPHVYGALWRVCERFAPELVLHQGDLPFAKALPVTWAYDDRAELAPGVTLLHTGGHTPGHTALLWRDAPGGPALFCGDAFKYTVDAAGAATSVSTHLAFDADLPLTRAQLDGYARALDAVDATTVVTPWEVVTSGGMPAARALLALQRAAPRPFTDRVVLGACGVPTGERVPERAWRAAHGAGRVVAPDPSPVHPPPR